MKKKQMWRIVYDDVITGEERIYMNVAYETEERAQMEVDCIKREEKRRDVDTIEKKMKYLELGMRTYSIHIGTNFRTKPVMVTPISPS